MTNIERLKDNDKPAKSRKHRYQLDLLEEKQAFVVIALTDRLSRNAKDVAFNSLAHYNSERGQSWASLATIATECGMSPTSTKTVRAAFAEIEKVGAFSVVRRPPTKHGEKSRTHLCCPIMKWFRDEYQRLQMSGRLGDEADPFEELREQNRQGAEPYQIGSAASSDGVDSPVTQGSEPYKENGPKRTDLNQQTESPLIPEYSASGLNPDTLGNDNRPRRLSGKYQQTKLDADRAFDRLREMNWRTAGQSDDPSFDPSDRAERRGALVQWHVLLKEGRAASDIVLAAGRFLRNSYSNQRPSLAGFLGRYARAWMDESDDDLNINVMEPPVAANDDLPLPDKKVSGYDDDVPF